jgi:hypothetical protein
MNLVSDSKVGRSKCISAKIQRMSWGNSDMLSAPITGVQSRAHSYIYAI